MLACALRKHACQPSQLHRLKPAVHSQVAASPGNVLPPVLNLLTGRDPCPPPTHVWTCCYVQLTKFETKVGAEGQPQGGLLLRMTAGAAVPAAAAAACMQPAA